MTADPPDVAAVLRAIVPPPRNPLDEPCTCEDHAEERRREQALAEWRALNNATRAAARMRGAE